MSSLLPKHTLRLPTVTLVGRMQTDFAAIDALLASDAEAEESWTHPQPLALSGCEQVYSDIDRGADWLVEFGGRLCYRSFGARASGKTHAQYVENLLKQGHGSVLEHAVFSFALAGVSRTLTHELLRHRVGVAVSQLSQRYVNDPTLIRYVIPPALLEEGWDSYAMVTWRRECEQATEAYAALLATLEQLFLRAHPDWNAHTRRKAAAEAARSVLPGCVETRLLWTVNARTLRHVLHLRGAQGVDAEFRRFAVKLAQETLQHADVAALLPDLRVGPLADGQMGVTLDYGSV